MPDSMRRFSEGILCVLLSAVGFSSAAAVVPDDPRYPEQWGTTRVGAEEAWDIETGDTAVLVSIVGTGADYTHEDFCEYYNAALGWDFVNDDDDPIDLNGYSTHQAGTLCAAFSNGIGIAGLAPHIELMAVKVLPDHGGGSVEDMAAGIDWSVAKGADIILIGGGISSPIPVVEAAVNAAQEAGVLLIAESGNNGSGNLWWPARYAACVAVGAVDIDDERASFSNYGQGLELVAPGVDILSIVPGGYANYSGTGMAAAHVAGVAALILSHPAGHTVNVREYLAQTAEPLGSPGWDQYYGYGLVRADVALEGLETVAVEGDQWTSSGLPLTLGLRSHPNPFNPVTTISYDLPRSSPVRIQVYDILGRRIRLLRDSLEPAGPGSAVWDGRNDAGDAMSSGVYLYRVDAAGASESKTLTLVR